VNLRRGLFRLWIVGSALFVLAVAFVSYSDIKNQFDGPELFVPVLCGEARGKAGTDYAVKDKRKPHQWDMSIERNPSDTCWYGMSNFRTSYPEYKALQDQELIRKRHEALGTLTFDDLIPVSNPWATLGTWAGIAFGIPLIVLALGSSLVWAFSGFAARRKPHA
jgi:hypothetical protein